MSPEGVKLDSLTVGLEHLRMQAPVTHPARAGWASARSNFTGKAAHFPDVAEWLESAAGLHGLDGSTLQSASSPTPRGSVVELHVDDQGDGHRADAAPPNLRTPTDVLRSPTSRWSAGAAGLASPCSCSPTSCSLRPAAPSADRSAHRAERRRRAGQRRGRSCAPRNCAPLRHPAPRRQEADDHARAAARHGRRPGFVRRSTPWPHQRRHPHRRHPGPGRVPGSRWCRSHRGGPGTSWWRWWRRHRPRGAVAGQPS